MSTPALLPLSLLEARVLGVLVEKERTVPDTYPLTLNALTAGCNQKTSRNPVLDASESEVLEAVERLRRHSLVIESSGNRVMRYAQNLKRVFELPSQSVALLATLALRGPQTAAELRANSERIHRFADVSSVEGFLHEMAEREAGPLVALLPRQPGAREARWAHLLGGPISLGGEAARTDARAQVFPARPPDEPGVQSPVTAPAASLRANEDGGIEARLARLEAEVEALKTRVAVLLGESSP